MNDFKNTIGFIPYVFSTITCVLILFLPKNKRNCIINLGMCLLTAVLYLYSAYLAWNGKYIGLLAANPVVGETDLVLFRNDGTQVGDIVNIFKADSGRQKYDAADLAASGSTFGIVSTSSSGTKTQFAPVTCN